MTNVLLQLQNKSNINLKGTVLDNAIATYFLVGHGRWCTQPSLLLAIWRYNAKQYKINATQQLRSALIILIQP